MPLSPGDRTRLVIAVAVNLAVGQTAATWVGLPRWAGSIAAGGAMAAATMPNALPAGVREVAKLLVLPGNLAAQALSNQVETLEGTADATTSTDGG